MHPGNALAVAWAWQLLGKVVRSAPGANQSATVSQPLPVAPQHDLARHAALRERFLRLPRLREREALRDDGIDLALHEQLEQSSQVLPEQRRPQPLEGLD